jgi:hypothetical protein
MPPTPWIPVEPVPSYAGDTGGSEGRRSVSTSRTHLVVGGFPPGASAAHDMDYARLRLLHLLEETPSVQTTVSSDFG